MRKLIALALTWLILLPPASFALGLPQGVAWEARPTVGNSANGAGFALKIGTPVTLTDVTSDGSNPAIIYSSSHGAWTSDVMKNICFTAGPLAILGCYQILATAPSSGATLDRSVGGTSLSALTAALYPGIDRSQQTSPQVIIENSNITATTPGANSNVITFTGGSVGYTPTNADLGNCVNVTGGTNINTGRYCITGETGTTWTVAGPTNLTTAAGAGSAVTGRMGGAADIPDSIAAAFVGGERIFVKTTGTWTTGGVTFAQAINVGNVGPYSELIGYTTTRGDGGQVTVQPSGAALTLLTLSGQGWRVKNFFFDGTGANETGTAIAANAANLEFTNIKVNKFSAIGIDSGTLISMVLERSEITGGVGCTEALNTQSGGEIYTNNIHDNGCPGIVATAGYASNFIRFNRITANTGNGIIFENSWVIEYNTLDSDGIAISGIGNSSGKATVIHGNMITNNTTGLELWTSAGWAASPFTDGNCYYGNTNNFVNSADEGITNAINGVVPYRNIHDVLLASSPYISGTFALQASSAAVAASLPSAFPGTSDKSYMSCGAFQPQVVSGGSAYVQ